MQTKLNIAVLILDDDKNDLEFIGNALRQNGIINYHLFTSDQDFMAKLTENMHILVLDHNLKGPTGLDVMKMAMDRNPNVFVIAISGVDNAQLVIDYYDNGCRGFILKSRPDYLEKLVQYVKKGIRRFEMDMEFFGRQLAQLS
jgi:DNA-binding NtrC family response regulator